MNAVLMVAGGSGTRMGMDIPKQFYEVNGQPIIMYGLTTFEKAACVDAVYVVCSEAWADYLRSLVQKYALSKVRGIITGGATRQDSVYNGVMAMAETMSDEDYVCMMDANRPLVDEQDIQRGFDAAHECGAAVACDDCVDTMYLSEDKKYIGEMLDRSKIFKGQAPEVARFSLALETMQKARADDLPEQPLAALLQHYGWQVALIPGSRKNFKITTAEDLDLFQAYLLLEQFKAKPAANKDSHETEKSV